MREQAARWPRYALLILGIFLLLQGWLAAIPGRGTPVGEAVSRLDDFVFVALFLVLLVRKLVKREPIRAPLLLPAIGFLIFGVASGLVFGQTGFRTALGAYTSLKAYMVFLMVVNVDWSDWPRKYDAAVLAIAAPIVLFAVVEFIFPGLRGLLHLPPALSPRLGRSPAQSIFIHPGVLGSVLAYSSVFAFSSYAARGRKLTLGFALLLLVGSVLTLRLKPLLGIVIALPLLGVLLARRSRRWKPVVVAALVVLVLFGGIAAKVAGQQLNSYLTDPGASSEARNVLYATGGRIAWDHFPLGSGFGTFASWASRIDYSPVYKIYRVDHVWGLSKSNPKFVMDTFWPAIVGETGALGTIAYCLLLMGMASAAFSLARKPGVEPGLLALALGGCLAFAEALAESLGSPVFFQQPTAFLVVIPLGMCWGLAMKVQTAEVEVPIETAPVESDAIEPSGPEAPAAAVKQPPRARRNGGRHGLRKLTYRGRHSARREAGGPS
jgi:hypothetical protein